MGELVVHKSIVDAMKSIASGAGNKSGREKIQVVQDKLLQMEQADTKLTHHFSLDVYGRELTLPAGTLAVGKIHKDPCINILLKGTISLYTELRGVETFSAPHVVVTVPGEKKVGYAHDEVKWMTVHATTKKDPVEIIDEITTEDYNEIKPLSDEEYSLIGSKSDEETLMIGKGV